MAFRNSNYQEEERLSRNNSSNDYFSKFNKKLDKKTSALELLPYKRMTDHNQFVNTYDQLEEFYLIRGKALRNTSTQEGMNLISDFRRFAKTYVDDVKIIVSMYPTETFEQQRYFMFKSKKALAEIDKLERTIGKFQAQGNMEMVRELQHRIKQLRLQNHYIKNIYLQNEENVSKFLKNQEYLMVIYGDDLKDIRNKVDNIKRWSGNALELIPISPDKKVKKVATFLNPTRFLSKMSTSHKR